MMPRQTLPVCHSTERGNVLILTAVTLFVMLGMMALAIDVGHLLNGKAQLQSALDAAALAAAAEARVVIKSPGVGLNEEIRLVTKYGMQFGNLNMAEMSRSVTRPTALTLQSSNISLVDLGNNLPSITVSHEVPLTTFFAGILGFSEVNISASSRAAAVVVDGGTGLISGGVVGAGCNSEGGQIVSGCWRPILIPDTYYDSNLGRVTHLSENLDFSDPNLRFKAPPEGSYYISRFASKNAGSARSGFPFVDACAGSNCSPGTAPPVTETIPTSLRDAATAADRINNYMGSEFRVERSLLVTNALRYRVVDFGTSYPGRTTTWGNDAGLQALWGYCGAVQIGDRLTVFGATDGQNVPGALQYLRNLGVLTPVDDDKPNGALPKFGYVKSRQSPCRFETPNTHPLIIPVLLCNPFEFYRNSDSREFTITNFGALYLTSADADGVIQGWFVREVISGGTMLNAADDVAFPRYLPVSIRLAQ